MQTYLQSLANKQNSGEKLNTSTNFETELTLICTPPSGIGRGRERSVGRRNVKAFFKAEHSVITVKQASETTSAALRVKKIRACSDILSDASRGKSHQSLQLSFAVLSSQAIFMFR